MKKISSVTFKDQVLHPISSSHMNDRYSVGPSKAPPKALARNAQLNLRYVEETTEEHKEAQLSDVPDGYEFPLGSPVSPRPSSVQEAPQIHQDIMVEINEEIKGGKHYANRRSLINRRSSRGVCLLGCWLLVIVVVYIKHRAYSIM